MTVFIASSAANPDPLGPIPLYGDGRKEFLCIRKTAVVWALGQWLRTVPSCLAKFCTLKEGLRWLVWDEDESDKKLTKVKCKRSCCFLTMKLIGAEQAARVLEAAPAAPECNALVLLKNVHVR